MFVILIYSDDVLNKYGFFISMHCSKRKLRVIIF